MNLIFAKDEEELTCPHCGQKYRPLDTHIFALDYGSKRLETCLVVIGDFIARNIPSRWVFKDLQEN